MVESSERSLLPDSRRSDDPGAGTIHPLRTEGLAQEPEDADLTGSRRSLQRRLLGLNVADEQEPLSRQAVERPARGEVSTQEHTRSEAAVKAEDTIGSEDSVEAEDAMSATAGRRSTK